MSKYGGMTLNERLFGAGLLDAFDSFIKGSDDEGAVSILTKVELSPDEAKVIVAAVRQHPAKYGYPNFES